VALANDGGWFSSPTPQIVNYRVQGNRYVVDAVLDRAALISGVGSGQQRVVISRGDGCR
jgi:type IV secretion system protein TrbG